jgi:hypothetical protein
LVVARRIDGLLDGEGTVDQESRRWWMLATAELVDK